MPDALTIGIPYELFWHLNPKKLKPFQLAYKKRQQELDAQMHMWWGNYGISALIYAIEHCLAGNKAKSQYVKESILSKFLENDGLTQEEIDNREIQKMILAEEMWIKNDIKRGLKETITK